jgi:uncharacterized protein YqeY
MVTPMLKDRLQSDLTDAIRSRDELRSATLRMVLTAIKSAEVAGSQARTLSDDEVLSVLRSEAKKRREAAEAFGGAGRADRADRERAEEQVIEGYLPAQMDDATLAGIVSDAVAEASAAGQSGMAAMGTVMGLVRPRIGQQAEGGRVAAEVRRQLQG